MSGPTIETDLGKILDQINQNLKETNQKLDALQKDVTFFDNLLVTNNQRYKKA